MKLCYSCSVLAIFQGLVYIAAPSAKTSLMLVLDALYFQGFVYSGVPCSDDFETFSAERAQQACIDRHVFRAVLEFVGVLGFCWPFHPTAACCRIYCSEGGVRGTRGSGAPLGFCPGQETGRDLQRIANRLSFIQRALSYTSISDVNRVHHSRQQHQSASLQFQTMSHCRSWPRLCTK